MRLIDADELIKDDEVSMWLSNDAVRTGKTLKMFSELFVKKINKQPTVEAIPKAEYMTRLKDDMVDMLEEIQIKASNIYPNIYTCCSFTEGIIAYDKLIQQKIDALKEEKDERL